MPDDTTGTKSAAESVDSATAEATPTPAKKTPAKKKRAAKAKTSTTKKKAAPKAKKKAAKKKATPKNDPSPPTATEDSPQVSDPPSTKAAAKMQPAEAASPAENSDPSPSQPDPPKEQGETTPRQDDNRGRHDDRPRERTRSQELRERRNHSNRQDGESRGRRFDRGNNRNRNNRRGDRNRDRDRDRNRDGGREGGREGRGRPEPKPLGPPQDGEGLLEISGKGFGFLRQRDLNFAQAPDDIFVTPETVRSFGLRDGMWIEGEIREGSRGPQLTDLRTINGAPPKKYKNLPIFEELTAINPNKRIQFETESKRFTTRIIDMMAPVGRGQRGLIVSPPRAGKTTLLQHIAEAVMINQPEMKLIILLVDERPEEVTEISRSVPGAEIFASSNDSDNKSHTRIAMLAIERAKRLVEAGEHVFVLLDSITRLARAFNNAIKGGGRGIGSGGITVGALEIPRRLFAAARNTREAGSLTIVATALVETGSRADDAIFQEFKGTGNMELVLDRKIAEQYIFPAVDIFKSGTRREELLLPAHQLEKIYLIRRGLSGHKPFEAVERLLHFCEKFENNAQMLVSIPGGS